MEEQLKDIREVVATLIGWAATEGLGYIEATRLMNKLYSGMMRSDNGANELS